jgi:hypothetical protein
MKRAFWARKILMGIVIGSAAVMLIGFIVMNLWNAILPAVIHVSAITFWQAVGLLLLSKILFGGFRGGWGGGRRRQWKEQMSDKWKQMTPEERDQFKQEWRNRCSRWKRPSASEQQAAE